MNENRTIFIAHRGESYDAPENTLAAINLAWERDADAVEVDVHLSKDGKIVVIHDNNTGKFAGKDKLVKDQTLEELQRIHVGKLKGANWINERIPTLEQIFQTVPEGKCLFIEIKCGPEILKELKNLIEKSKLQPHQVKLIGFDYDVMKNARKISTEIEIFWIQNVELSRSKNAWQSKIMKLINKAMKAKFNGFDFSATPFIDKSLVNHIKAYELKLYIWTVNDPSDAIRFIEAGVDGITTDRAQWLKNQLGDLGIRKLGNSVMK